MTVETTARFISDLNEAYPRARDLISEGDDHIRMMKAVLKNTMPGFTSSTTMTSDKLNQIDKTFVYDEDGTITINNSLTMSEGKELDAGGNVIKNVGDPVDEGDAVTLKYMQGFGAWPVGAIFMTVDSRNPKEIFGFGTWEEFAKGRVIIGTGQNTDDGLVAKTFVNEQKGGFYEVKISTDQLPEHAHNLKDISTSNDGAHRHENGYISRTDATNSNMPFGLVSGISRAVHTYEHHKYYEGSSMGYTSSADAKHSHTLTGDTGAVGKGSAVTITQPFIAVNIWKRTA